MQLCNDLNIQNAIFEGDAKAVIMAVKGDEENFSYFGSLIDDIRNVLSFRKSWSLQFDYRDKNTVAHNLAKAALHIVEEKVWIEIVPDFIVNSLVYDRRYMQDTHI
ncbi:hypothetical protein F2P56_030784 [Juglans regia]|nr:hypothetical protein F2P56_030784 [Juglans regia]